MLAAISRKIDFGVKAEAFFGDEDGREMSAFFENTKGAIVGEGMKIVAFGETVGREGVVDFAWRTQGRNKDSDTTEDNECKKSPPAKKNRQSR